MHISDNTIEKLLARDQNVTKEQVDTLKEEGARSRRPLQDLVIQNGLMDEKTLTQAFAELRHFLHLKDTSKPHVISIGSESYAIAKDML